MTKLTKKLY